MQLRCCVLLCVLVGLGQPQCCCPQSGPRTTNTSGCRSHLPWEAVLQGPLSNAALQGEGSPGGPYLSVRLCLLHPCCCAGQLGCRSAPAVGAAVSVLPAVTGAAGRGCGGVRGRCLLETSPADGLGGLLGGDDAVWLLIKQPWRSLLAGLCSSFPCFFTRMPGSRKQEERV